MTGARPLPFPEDAITLLEDAGALAFNAVEGDVRPPAAEELELVRAVARADASVGRIFDGHLNGVERLAVQAPPALRDVELAEVRDRQLRVGVWGGDPRPGEGPRATVERRGDAETLSGVKTFCSGAGGLDRALVLARDPDAAAPVAVWIDLTDSGTVDGGRALVPRLRLARLGLAPGRVRPSAGAGAVRAAGRPVRATVVRPRRAAHRGELGGDGRPRAGRRARRARRPAAPGRWSRWRPGGC